MYSANNSNKNDMVYVFSFSDLGIVNIGNNSQKREDFIQKSYREKLQQREQQINNPEYFQQEIMKIMEEHVGKVGKNQAVLDFQKGINLLNQGKDNLPIVEKQPLKEDGIWGDKTLASFLNIFKNYSPAIVIKYIRRGALNNVIFDTKNDVLINTEKKVNEVFNNLKLEGV